jgi:hypothetical protein
VKLLGARHVDRLIRRAERSKPKGGDENKEGDGWCFHGMDGDRIDKNSKD